MTHPLARPLTARALLALAILLLLVGLPARAFAADAPPADPAKPAEPPKPADPAKPAEPAKPEDPAKPAEPAKPEDPAKPAEPPKPVEPPPPPPDVTKLSEALIELNHLTDYLKKGKSDNQDILASLDEVAKAYKGLVPDAEPAPADWESKKDDFHKKAEKAFVDALELVRVRPNSKSNERDDVNVKAAQLLGETRVFKAKGYEPATGVYDAAFLAIARLNDKKAGLPFVAEWMKYSSTPGDVDRIKAAFEAVIVFTDIKGSDRRALVEGLVRTFVGVESAANRGNTKEEQAQKRVWDKIKGSVVKALQVLTKEAKAPDGGLIGTIADFDKWYRDNDAPRNPAWADPPKVVGEQK